MQQGRVLTELQQAERLDAECASRARRCDWAGSVLTAGPPEDSWRAGSFERGPVLRWRTVSTGNDEPFNLQRVGCSRISAQETLTRRLVGSSISFGSTFGSNQYQVEDKELLEAALGGADKSARIRTMRRARVLKTSGM